MCVEKRMPNKQFATWKVTHWGRKAAWRHVGRGTKTKSRCASMLVRIGVRFGSIWDADFRRLSAPEVPASRVWSPRARIQSPGAVADHPYATLVHLRLDLIVYPDTCITHLQAPDS